MTKPRGTRKRGPRTKDGTRRKDKQDAARQGMPQWLRRYRDRNGTREPT